MKKHTGFTLIELMITLAIVGILLTIGVPSLKTFMQGNQLIASTNELLSALHVARSEAIKLNSRVSICESDDGANCTTTGNWENGWIVFVDVNGTLNNTGTACTAINTNCLLRVHEGFDGTDITITARNPAAATVSSFTFTSRGLPKAVNGTPESGTFSVCSMKGAVTIDSRAVVLGLPGRVRVSDNAAVITCP